MDRSCELPMSRFTGNLPGFPYEPKYVEMEGLRMAYVEHGSGAPILMLHGEPTWGYLYRHMIPPLAAIGRIIAPDLIGFGRSDKPVAANAYSYKSHTRWLRKFIEALDLKKITMVCQDWGGLLGLRILAEQPERFARLVAMNTGIPAGDPGSEAFHKWRRFSQGIESLDVPRLMRNTIKKRQLSDAEAAAYGAPFPSKEYQTAALAFPRMVPIRPDDPGAYENRVAVERLKTLDPCRCCSPGAKRMRSPHAGRAFFAIVVSQCSAAALYRGASHFIQEDAGEEIATYIVEWIARNPQRS